MYYLFKRKKKQEEEEKQKFIELYMNLQNFERDY